MQITLNQNEVSQVLLDYIKNELNLDDSNNFHVELHTDEGVTVYINEDNTTEQASTASDKPAPARRGRRRTKAEIEADNKAEAERLAQAQEAASGNESSGTQTTTTSAPVVKATEVAQAEVVGETTPEASAPGEAEPETDPSNAVDTSVAVAAEPEVQAEADPVAEDEPVRKPTTSLFANLRKPNNG